MMESSPTVFRMCRVVDAKGMSLAESFNNEDEYLCVSPHPKSRKFIIRISCYLNWKKSSFMKNKINTEVMKKTKITAPQLIGWYRELIEKEPMF